MKTLLLILALVVTHLSYGQKEPFKGAKTIVLTCSDSSDVLYKRLGQHLITKGNTMNVIYVDVMKLIEGFGATSNRVPKIKRHRFTWWRNSGANDDSKSVLHRENCRLM